MMRPRLGLLLVTSGWFRDVGLQGPDSKTSSAVERTARAIVERLSGFADPVGVSVLYSVGAAEEAGRGIARAGVDAVLLVPLMWCEDAIPRAALSHLSGIPVILWTFSPVPGLPDRIPFPTMLEGSGPVGAMQLSGMLKREGARLLPIAGPMEDPAVWQRLRSVGASLAVARSLRGARIGVLPFPCDQMSVTFVDPFGLRQRHEIEIRWLELERVRKAAQGFGREEIETLRGLLSARGVRFEVDERNLIEGIRYALALEQVVEAEGLSAIAMNDVIPEMHASFGLRPCLWNPRLSVRGTPVAMEADVGACSAMLALARLFEEPLLYTEPLSMDWEQGTMLLGHAGYHDASGAEPGLPVSVVRDEEYCNSDRFSGAAIYFSYRSGPATIVNSIWDGESLRWACVEGQSVARGPRLEGNCHLIFRPTMALAEFCNSAVALGVSQHWIVVPGHRAPAVEAFCQVAGIRYQLLAQGARP